MENGRRIGAHRNGTTQIEGKISLLNNFMKEVASESPDGREFIRITSIHQEAALRARGMRDPKKLSVSNGHATVDAYVDQFTNRLARVARSRSAATRATVDMMAQHVDVFVRSTVENKLSPNGK